MPIKKAGSFDPALSELLTLEKFSIDDDLEGEVDLNHLGGHWILHQRLLEGLANARGVEEEAELNKSNCTYVGVPIGR